MATKWLRHCFDSVIGSLPDSACLPDVREVRAMELQMAAAYRHPWFGSGYERTTVAGLCRDRYYGIYKNSFSRQRTLFDELGRVSLSNQVRL